MFQLVVMALAINGQNMAFIEDLNINETSIKTGEDWNKAINESSQQTAHNCWVAAGLYTATLLLSLHQFWLNNRGMTARYQRQL